MGMFDYVKCEYPLPDGKPAELFQTKDFDCAMEQYTITAEGRLIHHQVRMESVPEEDRPYYGTPLWNEPFFQLFRSMKAVPVGDVDMKFHGILSFCSKDRKFHAKFTDGNLAEITEVLDWL